MVAGGLELRFPTFLVDDLWGTVYSDFAAISPYWRTLGPDSIYSSVGGGLRYLVTGQIPLRLDVAYPLRETPFSPQEMRVHINIFYTL
jgi:outer membrane translocation and assembly module TamA